MKENEDRLLAVRLLITGTVAQTGQALRDRLTAAAVDVSPDIWLERIRVQPRADKRGPATLTLDAELKTLLAELAADPAVASELATDLEALRNSLPEQVPCDRWRDTSSIRRLALQIAEEI